MVRTWRPRSGLKGSAVEDWIVGALAKQSQPHDYEPGRAGGCRQCGLEPAAEVHATEAAS